jgi:hypothetical protein
MSELKQQIILGVQLDANDANANIAALQQKFNELSNVDPSKPFKTLKAELKEASVFAAEIERQFGANSKEFGIAAQRVAELKDRQGELNASFDAFNPDNKLQSLVSIARGATGAVQGVAGAMTFLGAESENTQAAIARLQGLMAFSDALGSVADIKDSFRNFNTVVQSSTVFQKLNAAATTTTSVAMKALGIAANTTSTGFKVLRGAIIATGIGALVIALVALISNFDKVKNAILNAIPGLRSFANTIGDIVTAVTDFVGITSEAERGLDDLKAATERLNEDGENRIRILEAQGKQEVAIYKEKAQLIENELNLLRQTLKVKGELSDEELKQFRKLKTDKEILSISEANRIQKEKEKEIEDERKKNEKIAEERKQASEKARQKREQDAAKQKQEREKQEQERKAFDESFEQNRVKAASDIDKRITDARLRSIKDEFTRKQFELDIQKQGEIDAAVEVFNTQQKLLKDALANNTITQKEFDDLELNAKTQLEKSKLLITGEYADKNNQLIAQKRKEGEEAILQRNVVQTETNLINTTRENRVLETDTPDVAFNKIKAIQDAQLAAENAAYKQKITDKQLTDVELQKLEAEHQTNLTNINDQASKARTDIDKREKEARTQNLQTLGSALGSIGNLIGQQTVAGKSLAIAQATIDTYAGASKALAQGGIFGTIQAVGIIAAGLANVRNIIKTKVPAKTGDNTSSQIPTIAQSGTAPIINAQAALQQQVQDVRVTNQSNQTIRAYIVDRDLDNNQQRKNFLNNVSRI